MSGRPVAGAVLTLVSVIALTLTPATAASAAPPNDDIADALPITGQWTVADLAGATLEPGEPDVCIERDPDFSSYEYPAAASAWYRYTAASRETVNGQIYDYDPNLPVAVHVFREVDGVLEHVTCADDEARAWFSFQAEAGEEFLMQLAAVPGSDQLASEAVLHLRSLPPIPNTTPASATQLNVPSTTSQSTNGSDYELSEPYGCLPEDTALMTDVWYRLTAPATGTLRVDASASNFPVNFAVYDDVGGAPGGLAACPPIPEHHAGYPGTGAAVVEFPAAAGQSFFVQVGGFYLNTGDVVLTVSQRVDAPPTVTRTSPVIGPRAGGTTVTITGTGFTPDSQVSFGALPATSVTYVSPTSLKAVTPRVPAARLVEVYVTTPAGTSPKALLAKFLYVR